MVAARPPASASSALPFVAAAPAAANAPPRARSRLAPLAAVAESAATAQRGAEPAWHRRLRRKRGDARALLRVASASRLLASHHSAQAAAASPSMVRGRWSSDRDGWFSRSERDGRSQSRGQGRRGDGSASRGDSQTSQHTNDLKKECEKLRKELDEARKKNGQHSQVVARPNAKEGAGREGDWMCGVCLFGTNRAARPACYRCGAAKLSSFPLGSRHVPSAGGHGNMASYASVAAAAQSQCLPSSSIPPSASTSSPTSSSTQPTGFMPSGGPHWAAQFATAPSLAAFAVPGFAGNPPRAVATAPAATVAQAQPVVDTKALKSRVDSLLEARSTLAANSLCSEALAAIDAQIARAKADLANAQPFEVALRGTLGAVTAARQALQKADAKASKLEQQVITAVAAYDAAAAEAAACRRQLADAEAATARTAGGHIDLRHLLDEDPGAAWAAFRAACEARCSPGAEGVDDNLRARAAAVFAEMQAVCALMPAKPPVAAPPSLGATAASAANPTSRPSGAQQSGAPSNLSPMAGANPFECIVTDAARQPQAADHGHAVAARPVDAGAVAAAAITESLNRQRQIQMQRAAQQEESVGAAPGRAPLLQPSSPSVPSQFEVEVAAAQATPAAAVVTPEAAVEAVELVPPLAEAERQVFQDQVEAAEREVRTQHAAATSVQQVRAQQAQAAEAASAAAAAARAQLGSEVPALPPVETVELGGSPPAAPAPVVPGAACGIVAGGSGPPVRDDAMGGGAEDSVVGKRSIAAIDSARAIAARAKARVSNPSA